MFCPSCGQENVTGARTCETCGTDLTKVTTEQPISRSANLTDSPAKQYIEYAGFWRRFAAAIIDGLLVGAVFWIAWAIIGINLQVDFTDPSDLSTNSPSGWFIILTLASYIVPWLYYALMEASAKQATLGKLALRIKVTDDAGNRVSFGKATGRHFGKILSGLILWIGYIMIAFTSKKQGLHDILAGTLVVKK